MPFLEIVALLLQAIPSISQTIHDFYSKTGVTTDQKVGDIRQIVTNGLTRATAASKGGQAEALSAIQPMANLMIDEAVAKVERAPNPVGIDKSPIVIGGVSPVSTSAS
ncbi:MAG: hypothetical protein HQK96_12880 [Nitrospirae bacterium]|nr:hypothetical protein [Nitrospirota bacterium]